MISPLRHRGLTAAAATARRTIPPTTITTTTTTTSTSQFSTTRRRPSSAVPRTAAEAADHLMNTFCSPHASPTVRRQLLDGNQLRKLLLTLDRPFPTSASSTYPFDPASASGDVSGATYDELGPVADGAPLPPGYHLVYFTPEGTERELGRDGTDRTFNAPGVFSRRMWAGGRMRWEGGSPGLKVGEVAEERTRLLRATPKKSKGGGEMVLVDVEKQIWGRDGLAVVDERSWIFRPEVDSGSEEDEALTAQSAVVKGPSTREDVAVEGEPFPTRHLRWSPVGLFRFSALTFNGHKIHYDDAWAQAVESHRGPVVHGPLNLIQMLDYHRDVHGEGRVREIAYRAMSPLYAGQTYSVKTRESEKAAEQKGWDVLVERDGTLCMKGTILEF